MTPVEVLAIVAVGGVATAVAKRSRGKTKPKRNGAPRSWLVTMYNNTGAAPVKSGDVKGATAELAGRAAGAVIRGNPERGRASTELSIAASRGLDRLADRAAPRWEKRVAARPPETIVDRWKSRRASAAPPAGRTMRFRRPDLSRVADRLKPRPEPPSTPPSSEHTTSPTAPRPAPSPVPPHPTPGAPMTATSSETAAPTAAVSIAVPADWAALIARVSDFTPESDVDLIDWMKGETAGMLGYAEGADTMRETCVTVLGLDPSSVAGISIFSEQASDAAARMSEAMNTFLTVYSEALQLVASGTVLPFDGRWMTGGGADS